MDILVTRRLTLRPPLEVDADAIFSGLSNPNVARMLASVPNPYSIQDAKDWIRKASDKSDEMHFTIHRQNLLGVASIEVKDKAGIPDLGYWLAEPYWGTGIMTEAARALVSHGFRKFGWDKIQSGAFEDNPGSQKILEKLGFEPTSPVQHHCLSRGEDVTCNRVILTRSRFERMFGPLDPAQAA